MNIKRASLVLCILFAALCTSACDAKQAHTHTPSDVTVRENVIKPTCENGGTYDEVVYCTECNEEVSRIQKTTEAVGHQYDGPQCTLCKNEKVSTGLVYISNYDGTCTVSGIGTCADVDVFIPQYSPNGEMVTEISASAFYDCAEITGVYIPETVTSIGNDAFGNCSKLQSVTLSDNLTSFGTGVFSGCTALKYNTENGMHYLESNTNAHFMLIGPEDKTKPSYDIHEYTVFIYDNAFSECQSLTSITVPFYVCAIGTGAFRDCPELVNVSLSNGITIIASNLFLNCQKLETVNIPEDVTVIEEKAFYSCAALKTVTLPKSLTEIGFRAFCLSGITSITVPNSVTAIGDGAFEECYELTTATLSENITRISKFMFEKCTKLQSVNIPNRVTLIDERAFNNCVSLEHVFIPKSVTTIEKYAFRSGCKGTIKFENPYGWSGYQNGQHYAEANSSFVNERDAALNLSVRWFDYTWKRQ